MPRHLALLFLFALGTSCTLHRELAFTREPMPVVQPDLNTPPLDRSWMLGDVYVEAASALTQQQQAQDWSLARKQLEDRLIKTLTVQPALGHRVEDRTQAELVVDLHVKMQDVSMVNGWLAAGILSELGILGAGSATGTAIGAAASHGSPSGVVEGLLVGFAISTIPAVIVPLLLPANTTTGSIEAELNFRRAVDGVSILEKHAHADWSRDYGTIGAEKKLAELSGDAVQSFEQELVRKVHEGLVQAPSGVPARGLDAN